MSGPIWYFAYGSNMSPAIFVERRGMYPVASRAAVLDGHRVRFNLPVGPGERGVANLEPFDGATTWGVAYLLSTEDCARLDLTEGVHRGYYERYPVEVVGDDGERLAAFTYRSRFAVDGRKPSPRYIGLLLEGARLHGLPDEYLRLLEAFELAIDERITT